MSKAWEKQFGNKKKSTLKAADIFFFLSEKEEVTNSYKNLRTDCKAQESCNLSHPVTFIYSEMICLPETQGSKANIGILLSLPRGDIFICLCLAAEKGKGRWQVLISLATVLAEKK